MKKYNVIIVEDEKAAQDQLIAMLGKHPDLHLSGQSFNLEEASRMVSQYEPDLIFCDVDLPPGNAFDWLMGLPSIPFSIIFTTSYDTYAIRAFRLAAVDYLLKPLMEEELNQALDKFRAKNQKANSLDHVQELLNNLNKSPQKKKIALPTLSGYLFVPIREIIRCESDNTYTTFHLIDKKTIIVSKTLKECETMLLEQDFFRVHNSHLINLAYVKEYLKGEGGQVKMEDGSYVDVSRRRKDEFLKKIR
ncbi:LytR/AlgR family response regulator transcription factor [Aquiflexum sp.]|uniref:LytR/AlgR family response regulator transcription factor n=1 Tax=Aquiflexum sp. TaxID=1872584 RepID=UPI0035934556